MFENHHRQKVAAHRQIRVRLCHKEQPQEGHLRAQGQHHEARRWPVLEKLRGGDCHQIEVRPGALISWLFSGFEIVSSHPIREDDCRQHYHATGIQSPSSTCRRCSLSFAVSTNLHLSFSFSLT